MNDRKNRSCETILKLLTKQIHTIWNMNKNKITTLLSMNVIEAFNHVSRERLFHNLKKRRISTWIIVWTNNFMQDKRINFIVKTKQTIMNNVNVDISQKSLMSSILYLFYNANLLKLLEQSSRKMIVIDFVNDINILIYDINTISNCRLLKKMHEHCLLWDRRHEVVFASMLRLHLIESVIYEVIKNQINRVFFLLKNTSYLIMNLMLHVYESRTSHVSIDRFAFCSNLFARISFHVRRWIRKKKKHNIFIIEFSESYDASNKRQTRDELVVMTRANDNKQEMFF
jgi:hypothetical protein